MRLTMHAQSHLVGFYEKRGFVAQGEEFVEAGIRHRVMVRGIAIAPIEMDNV